jgi:esterase/lipase superfamily enzyme
MLETTRQIKEGDLESWYAAWAATADRVEVLAALSRFLGTNWSQNAPSLHPISLNFLRQITP